MSNEQKDPTEAEIVELCRQIREEGFWGYDNNDDEKPRFFPPWDLATEQKRRGVRVSEGF